MELASIELIAVYYGTKSIGVGVNSMFGDNFTSVPTVVDSGQLEIGSMFQSQRSTKISTTVVTDILF